MIKLFWCKKLFLFFLFSQIAVLFAQNQKEIVAKAGDEIITKDEFYKRYEFTPHIKSKTAYDSASTKRDFIYTLIGEKLLASAAKSENVDKTHEFKMMMDYLMNIYLRDALYKVEVKDKIFVPDSELVKGEHRVLKSFHTKFIFSTDEKEIYKIYSEIKNGASFDSLLNLRSENLEQSTSQEVTFGTMNEKLEDIIYNLAPGNVTVPVKLDEGWYLCKVYSVTKKIFPDDNDKRKVVKIVKSRLENKLYQDFYMKFFKGKNVNADRQLFVKLSKVILNYVKENESLFKEQRNNKYRLVEKDAAQFEKKLSKDDLNSIFIKFSEQPVTLSQFLDYLSLEGMELEKTDEKYINSKLNSFIRTFIQNEFLSREAMRRGYDKLPDVASELKLWSDFYLSRLMMTKIFSKEKVTDDEAYEFFQKSNQIIRQPDQVKIAEILVKDLNTVELILDEIDKGENFNKLASKYTIRDSLKNRGGEFNYFAVSENGDLGKRAGQMKIGDIFGPIKTKDGYSIIKLLDKKLGKKIKYEKFTDAKEEIVNYLRTEKMYKNLDDITAKMAIDRGVEINQNVLQSIKVTNINMIVFRRFGFGGQLVAAPFSPDFSDWIKVYKELKKKLAL